MGGWLGALVGSGSITSEGSPLGVATAGTLRAVCRFVSGNTAERITQHAPTLPCSNVPIDLQVCGCMQQVVTKRTRLAILGLQLGHRDLEALGSGVKHLPAELGVRLRQG